jgi:hypothetical protein
LELSHSRAALRFKIAFALAAQTAKLPALPCSAQRPSGIRPNPKAAVSAMPVVSVKFFQSFRILRIARIVNQLKYRSIARISSSFNFGFKAV